MAKGSSPKKGSPKKGSPKKDSKKSPKKTSEKISKKDAGSKKIEIQDEEVKDVPITHVIFNVNGVLLNSGNYFENFINKLIRKYDHQYLPVMLKDKIANKTIDKIGKYIIRDLHLPMSLPEFLEHYKFCEMDMSENTDLMPGVAKVVKYFKVNNIQMGAISDYTDELYNSVILKHKMIFDNFSHCLCYGSDLEATKLKPAPDIFEVAAEKFKETPPNSTENILVFENTINGVDAAISAKMKVVWVADSRVDVSLHNFYKHLVVLKSLQDFRPQQFGLPEFNGLYSI